MSKHSKAAPRLLAAHVIDLLLAQEAPSTERTLADGYVSVHSPSLRPDTRIIARTELDPTLIDPSPPFGSYATTATCSASGIEFVGATVHTLVRTAHASEIGQLDADQIRRPDVPVPWVNDLGGAFQAES
jgi:hypothetical protein